MNAERMNFWNRRRIVVALLLAVTAAVIYALYRPRPMLVEVATVASGTFEQAIEEDGRLRLKNRYVIAAPTQATLLRTQLKVGDPVKAGDVLAVLEPVAPQMIDTRTRAVLQQRVGSAEASRRVAATQVQRARIALAQASLEADRATRLAKENFIAPAALEVAQLSRKSAQEALAAAMAEQDMADYSATEARAALARAEPASASLPAQRWSIKSPIDGQVLKLYQDSATAVTVGQPLLEIGNTAAMEAVIDVLSSDVTQIQPGAPVRMSAGTGTPALAGRVSRVEPVAFTKVSALGIEEQRVNVIVDLEAASGAQPALAHLGDGYRVLARITVSSRPDALLIPTGALVRNGPSWQVLVVENDHARARQVQVHDRNAEAAWLKEGLNAGDTVVLYPGSMVKDGQPVRAKNPAPG